MIVRRGRGRRGAEDLGVDLLPSKVNAERNEGDAEARKGVAKLIAQHRMLPPLIPPPEELSCGSHCSLRSASSIQMPYPSRERRMM